MGTNNNTISFVLAAVEPELEIKLEAARRRLICMYITEVVLKKYVVHSAHGIYPTATILGRALRHDYIRRL